MINYSDWILGGGVLWIPAWSTQEHRCLIKSTHGGSSNDNKYRQNVPEVTLDGQEVAFL